MSTGIGAPARDCTRIRLDEGACRIPLRLSGIWGIGFGSPVSSSYSLCGSKDWADPLAGAIRSEAAVNQKLAGSLVTQCLPIGDPFPHLALKPAVDGLVERLRLHL